MPEREPEIIRLLREQREALLRGEQAQFARLAREWSQMMLGLDGQIAALAEEMARLRATDGLTTMAQVYRLERYQALLGQTKALTELYARYAEGEISRQQASLAAQGAIDAAAALAVGLSGAGGMAAFNVLPVEAATMMIGLAGDGSPLYTLLRESYPDAVDGLTEALKRSMVEGWNPKKTARLMAQGMNGGLDRALTIARTEQMRAYRESTRMQYANSGVVRGYRRMAKHADDVCAACIMAEGRFYETMEAFEEHPRGHCTLLPVISGVKEPDWLHGEAWFLAQEADMQRKILTDSYYRAWKAGEFELKDLVTRKTDKVWGSWLAPTPLGQLRAKEE